MPQNDYLESRIGVMESKWYENRNTSVRELFNLLSELHFCHHHAYRYEMFGGEQEFKATFDRMVEKNGIHYLYVATHGEDKKLSGTMGSSISITKVANCISEADYSRGKLVGLYFGSCLFGNTKNLIKLLERGNKVRWIAGYDRSVDFIKSSIFDILFFNTLLSFRKDEKNTEIEAIKKTADQIKRDAPGLIRDLGFLLYLFEREQYVCLTP